MPEKIKPIVGSDAQQTTRSVPAKARELLQVRVGNLCLRSHSLKTGTEFCCQFSLIQTLIKKHKPKHPRKGKWLRLLQCVPFIYGTMKFICWLISNSDWSGR
jgi:hypothetical protein